MTETPAAESKAKMEPAERCRLSNQAVNLSLGFNIILAVVKTAIGIIGHSPALLADGINSTSDVVYNIVVSIFVRRAHKPADEEHPYGHTQFESIGALVVGAFVITTAITIFWDSINTLYDYFTGRGGYSGSSMVTLYIALATVVIKILLTIYTRQIGDKTRNPAVIALAQDHRNDIFSAAAVVIGISLSQLGYLWVDPLAGALVAMVILRTGLAILRDSTDDLMDTVPGKILNTQIRELLQDVTGVQGVDSVLVHRFGLYIVVNVAIFVDGNITVDSGDAIADEVEIVLTEGIDNVRAVHVHFHGEVH